MAPPIPMTGRVRMSIYALPFGCLVAIATHFVRFGDDHAFGGGANEALVAAALAGSIVTAAALLYAIVTAGSTVMTGTLAATRLRALTPGAALVFALAATLYYGIEMLEGNGIELGLPTALLALLAIACALALRAVCALVARLVLTIVGAWLALRGRRERLVWHLARYPQPLHASVTLTARRLGRAPPDGQRRS